MATDLDPIPHDINRLLLTQSSIPGENIEHLISSELPYYEENEGVDVLDAATVSSAAMSDVEGYYAERITIPTADSTINILRKHYSHHNRAIIKRTRNGSSICHCPLGRDIGKEYQNLRSLMETHARLELLKDVSKRIQDFEAFIINLKKLVKAETASWLAINKATDSELSNHQTNLTALSSICDEFRMHLNHWMCIKQRIQNNRWLRLHTPHMLEELRRINNHFARLQETAFWWTEKLLKSGMQVFAYVDRRSLTYNDVFSIVRGIEEFNTLIQLVRINSQEMKTSSTRFPSGPQKGRAHPLTKHMHIGTIDSNTVKPVAFIRLINSLAVEWAKTAVVISHQFLDSHPNLLQSMHCKRYRRVEDTTQAPVSRQQSPELLNRAMSTSDYFSESLNRAVQDDSVEDITGKPSPLLDFGKKEREYICKVIQIACQRTNLLKKNKFSTSNHADKKLSTLGETSALNDASAEDNEFIRSDTRRKSVSWGDSHDMALCRQLASKYDDALWRAFGARFEESLCYEIAWSLPGGHKTGLGCIDMNSSDSVKLLSSSISSAANKGFFTTLGGKHVSQVANNMLVRLLMSSCDIAIGNCLSSMTSDKATPIPLHNDKTCTRSSKLLRNAIYFLRLQLEGLYAKHNHLPPLKGSPSHHSYIDYRIKLNCITRLECITSIAEKWCLPKSRLMLNSFKISPFLLITFSDLPMLCEEIQKTVHMLQGELFEQETESLVNQLKRMRDYQEEAELQLYNKAVKLSAEILSEQMPNYKVWKEKNRDGPAEVQPYSESLVERILMPVFDGVKHMEADVQLNQCNIVLKAVCSTWTSYFLDHKIKLSVQGVEQLRADFTYMLDYIDLSITDETIKSKLQSSKPICEFNCIMRILSEQPGNSKSPSDSVAMSSRNKIHPITDEMKGQGNYDNMLGAEARIQWSNLRLRIPGRHPIFSCLKSK